MSDILFSTVEKMHGSRLWGKFLDAGTGLHSIKWVQTLPTTSWTAITADNYMRTQMVSDSSFSSKLRPVDQLIVGNWMNDAFNRGLGKYDTILADYLIGAVDGFSPYEQDTIIKRLQEHLTPSGRMYFIGMNPIPDEKSPPGNIISEIRRARDACILLGGHRTYREFPSSWMKRHIEAAGMRVVSVSNFTILHSEDSALRQIRVAKSKLEYMTDVNLRSGMERYLLDLEERARVAIRSNNGRIPLSFDYIIAAENANEENAGTVVDETNTTVQNQPAHDHPMDVEAGSETASANNPPPPSNTANDTSGFCGTS
jgi:hypothetical protein